MNRLDHDRVMGILGEVMELPEPLRAEFLDSTCADEPVLRQRVEELLRFAPSAAEVFDSASEQVLDTEPDRIGSYTDLEQIGQGGMAIVYKARQNHPVKRTVAIKLVKLGMDTQQFVARFEAERQALAIMDHPGVARVYDAGATDTGRPYFVMEYVPGKPILDFCDERKLPTRERLELFIAVCDAVEHAHRKGILHRDIKSSNVLTYELEGRAMPKVIDFGVAKALQEPLTDRALLTEIGQLIGTPEYMSPEQAERGALAVDTRSDVYSLGVLLYELIAGVQPIPSDVLRGGSYEDVQRIIRDTDPPRPSSRLSSLNLADGTHVAQSRQVLLPSLIRQLRSELEWIPLKAMRRDREQRYRSAAELADDIRNYLEGRPLIAGPESTSYLLRKLVRRHKTGVAAVTMILLLLIAGIVTTTWQAVRAGRAEARAFTERDNAQATLDFLIDDVLSGATPARIPDVKVRDQIVKAMIEPAAERVGSQFADRPLIEARIRDTIRGVLMKIGQRELALPHAEEAVTIYRRELGDDDLDTLGALNNYAFVLDAMGRAGEAEPVFKQVLDQRRRILGPDDPKTLNALSNYAHALGSLGRWAEAEPLHREALERRRRVLGDDHPDTILSLNNQASALRLLDRATEAEPLYRQALESFGRVLGEDDPQTITALNNYAYALKSLDRQDEAIPLFKETLERRRRVLGEEHPDSIWSLGEYALTLQSQGQLDKAEQMLKQALDQSRRVQGADHGLSVRLLNNYAFCVMVAGRAAKAEPLLNEALERRRRVLGDEHPDTLTSLNNYATVLRELGRAAEAEPLARQAARTAMSHPSLGPDHRNTHRFAATYAEILDDLNRPDEASAIRKEFALREPATQPTTRPKDSFLKK